MKGEMLVYGKPYMGPEAYGDDPTDPQMDTPYTSIPWSNGDKEAFLATQLGAIAFDTGSESINDTDVKTPGDFRNPGNKNPVADAVVAKNSQRFGRIGTRVGAAGSLASKISNAMDCYRGIYSFEHHIDVYVGFHPLTNEKHIWATLRISAGDQVIEAIPLSARDASTLIFQWSNFGEHGINSMPWKTE
ncbi:hypothetical protein Pan181_47750 [Aeoliella mucimassa]|uniref:Uncharacterized protein n=2 Tax=Aeoliella mucimassa TaxID=2527972 RepID=A0A518AUY3_9BACT|nr:hypothetical protein Pan181_47750 [Aeoliella mucimassa]